MSDAAAAHEAVRSHKQAHKQAHKHKHKHKQHDKSHADEDTAQQQQQQQQHVVARGNGAGDEEDWAANAAQLEALGAQPENRMCNDCNDSGTRWASVNHGVFVCIRCAGVHRALGTHVSKVKSTTMDKWTASEVRLMAAIGNARGKAMYEASLTTANSSGSGSKNKNSSSSGGGGVGDRAVMAMTSSASDAQLRDFIERKYARYAFACDDVRRLLRRVHKQVGYHSKAKTGARDGNADAPRTTTNTTASSSSGGGGGSGVEAAASGQGDKAAPTRVSRAAVVKAFYGDNVLSASKAAGGGRGGDGAGKKTARVKVVHGTFGVVNVSAEEHAERLQLLLDAFDAA